MSGPAPEVEGSAGRAASRAGRGWAALAGIASAVLTLGVGQLAAALTSPSAAPLVVVGDAVVDLVPPWLKDLAIAWFGTADKAVLLATVGALVAVLAAVAGLLARRRPAAGVAVVAALGAVGVLAALTRPDAGPLTPLPSALGAVAGALALVGLVPRVGRPAPAGRRALLVGGFAAGGLVAAGAGRLVSGRRSAEASRAAVVLPSPASPAAPLPPGVDPLGGDLTPYVTPNADFYRIDTALVVPDVPAETWRLRVHGMVEEELEIGFDELLALPLTERWITMTCVSNEVGGDLAGNARWLGYPLADLLARVRPREGADMLLATSVDGFTLGAPLADVVDGRDALLAVGMNGEPLPREHGFPVRMVVSGLYGYVSACKWVVDLEVTRFADRTAYWTERGWAERGPVKTASRIDVPRSFARLEAGPVTVAGVAWAQDRGIERVEVRVDDEPWREARIVPSVSDDTWCQWVFDWDAAEAGSHRLAVRATDGTGEVQTQERAAPVPDGASGWHTVTVSVG